MPTYVGIASLVTLILGLIILFNYPGLVSDLLFFASLCMAIFALVKKCRWKAFPIVTVVVNVLIILLVVYLFGKGELTTAKEKMKNGSIKSAVTTTQNSHVNPELKSFLDSYESFVDDYVKLMEKYKKDPTNLSLLSDYYSFIGKLADFETKLGKIDASKLSGDDYAYYIDVTSRCTQKMLTVTK